MFRNEHAMELVLSMQYASMCMLTLDNVTDNTHIVTTSLPIFRNGTWRLLKNSSWSSISTSYCLNQKSSEITIASSATYCNYTKQDTCANKLIVNETIYAEI